MTNGIYTLANDVVFDQLVALLNSIEANAGQDIPVCVIAYDNRLDRIKAEVATRKNVTILDNPELFAPWEEFSKQVWATHPNALDKWKEKGINGVYRLECNHRYAVFDERAPFDQFIYLDADTLLLGSPDLFFEQLKTSDFVTYDFQYKDPSHIFNVSSPKLLAIVPQEHLNSKIFCSGCYASKRGLFNQEQRDKIVAQLANDEAEILYLNAPNQSVLNYMAFKSGISMCNLAVHLPESRRAGNSVTSPHFEEKEHILYDRGRQLTYLHYIGLSSSLFRKVSEGENIDFPYRDLFLHYRFLHQPEKQPVLKGKAKAYNAPPSLAKRVLRKVGLVK